MRRMLRHLERLGFVSAEPCFGRASGVRAFGIASLCALASLLVAGCGGTAVPASDAEPESGIVDLTDPTKPIPEERFIRPNYARIAPGDQIYIKALSYEDLNGTVTVAQDGRINLSLIGNVDAAGLSVAELDSVLTDGYSSYFRNFDIAVILVESAPRNVYVLGQVRASGRFPFSPGDRVLHGLALAGGLTDSARENSVILMRREADGEEHVYRLDFARMHHAVAPQDIYLQPSDIVYVPKSRFRTFTDFSKELLEVVQRATISALLIDDLVFRKRVQDVVVGSR